MASNTGKLRVWIATDNKAIEIPCSSTCTAEDMCIHLCKKSNISPLTRPLFALRIKGTNFFLKDNSTHLYNTPELELRIRFKIPRLYHLISLDESTYDYYYKQVRNDVNDNKIPEIKYPDHKNELLGLGITDMYRACIEENRSLSDVEKNYKIYVPKVIVRKHGGIPKKCAKKSLPNLCKVSHDVNYVKGQYLQQIYMLAPNYLSEEFKDVVWKHNGELHRVNLHVAPYHAQYPGLRIYDIGKNEWFHVCPIEDLIYLTRNDHQCVEVSRRGTPMFFSFRCDEELDTFISVCDGYYRLMVKWTFNLSKDDETPSLKELNRLKCHGPVGGAFSYRKLEEKRGKKHGCFILRQCQDDYNVYYLDVCTKNSTTTTYKVEFRGDCYVFNNEKYESIDRLISSHKNPEGMIYLNECIPASEYDKSQLLLCGESIKKGVRIDQADLQEILKDNRSPRCLSTKDILLYTGSEKYGAGGITATHTALWKLDETRKMKVAFKTLQKDKTNEYFKDFIDLASSWACVQSSMVVRLYGITLASPTALVLEYLHYGPFDQYLKNNGDKIDPLHLKKVAAGIARALWDLSEAGLVHGYIRCNKLLLAAHEGEKILVKLTGPSLQTYDDDDIHWIPVEFFSDKSLARRSVYGDIWAFATTMWEVFSYGVSPNEVNPILTAKSYEMGTRLSRPVLCPPEVWCVLWSSWASDPHSRPRPQEIMRDMSRLLHTEYIPPYAEPKFLLDDKEDYFGSFPNILSDSDMTSQLSVSDSSLPSESSDNKSSKSMESISGLPRGLLNTSWPDLPELPDEDYRPRSRDSWGHSAPRLMECIVSQGKTYLVTIHKKIGSGNYGNVYKGWMESENQESQRREVAIKKLTRQDSERNGNLYDDFKNELEIMKSLQHVNVVEILGYSWEPGCDVLIVMEYLEEGSLNQFLKFRGDKLKTHHLLKYALDIATGMDHISAKNVIHRDLATRNILVVDKSHVKISDFGLARMLTKEESAYKIKTERLLPINWYAPESAVKPWTFSTKSDVWSYGVTVWEIFTRAAIDVPKFDLERPNERASCFQIPDGCSSEIFRHLMKECWNFDPAQRPSFIKLVHSCKRFLVESAEYKNNASVVKRS